MIILVAIILAAVLAFLLVDWQGITRRRTRINIAKPSKNTADSDEGSQRTNQEDFLFDAPMEAEAPAQLEEEVVPGYVPSSEVEQLLSEADIHFRKSEMKAAEELYLKAAAQDPRCSKAYSRLGIIYLENGDCWEDAEAAFRQALKMEPNNGFILNNLGLVLYHQDRYADAIRHFESAVRQDEQNAARHANLGMGYMAMRQYAKAESSFKKALKLAPNEMEYKDLLNESIEKKKAHKTMVRR
jgi:tetratricopeptide (TPR) repeat protein